MKRNDIGHYILNQLCYNTLYFLKPLVSLYSFAVVSHTPHEKISIHLLDTQGRGQFFTVTHLSAFDQMQNLAYE